MSYGWEVISKYLWKGRRFSKVVGHVERKFQTEGGVAHQSLLVSEN